MTTIPTTERALTAHDTRALRNADTLCFDHLPDGTGRIRAIRRAENTSDGYEHTHTVPVSLSLVADHEPGEGPYSAFHMIGSPQYDGTARTLVRHMRAGCRVALMWTRGNASPVTDDAGLVRDELRLRVQSAGSDRADSYLVAVSVGLDNSARMVRAAH